MAIARKITRILIKTLKYAFLLIILLLVFTVIAMNTEGFQTWLAHRATEYLSEELQTKVSVGRVKLAFIKSAELEDVYVEDKRNDTLLYSKRINIEISGFSYKLKRLRLDKIELHDTRASVVKYKNDTTFNFQHLVDYFSSDDTSVTANPWDVKYSRLSLNNIDFIFRNENEDQVISENMNFNNLHLRNVSGNFSNIHFVNDSIYVRISGLRCDEQSGFRLRSLNATAKIAPTSVMCRNLILETPGSYIKGSFAMRTKSYDDYSDFVNKVNLKAILTEGTKLHFKDIACFVKELNGLNKTVSLRGKINGFVNDIRVDQFNLRFGDHTNFLGNFTMRGLPDINRTLMNFDVRDLQVTKADLEKIPLYPFTDGKNLRLPNEIGKFGIIRYRGKYIGHVNDFISYGTFNSALGSISTDLSMNIDTVTKVARYKGRIKTPGFNLGKLLGNPMIGVVAVEANVKGKGLMLSTIDAEFNGHIHSLVLNSYTYKNIEMKASIQRNLFVGDLVSKDPNADFDFNGKIDFRKKMPDMDFISTVNKLDLQKLNFTKKEGVLSTQILTRLSGDNINNLTGEINLDNTIYKDSEKTYRLSTFDLKLDQATSDKTIQLNSNYFNLLVNGRFNFTNLPLAFNQFLNSYYPAFFDKNKGKTIYTDQFKYKINIKKFNTIKELYLNNLMVSPNTIIEGDFDASKNLVNFNLKSDSISVGSIKFNNNTVKSFSQNNKINLVFTGDNIQLSDSLKIYNYFSYFVSKDKNTKFNFEWDNKTTPKNAGRFFGNMLFDSHQTTLTYDKIFITTHDSTWNLVTSNPTVFDSSGSIMINPLLFTNRGQSISLGGNLSGHPRDKLSLELGNFNLKQLSPLFGSALQIEGIIDGGVTVHQSLKSPAFSSNLDFHKLKVNGNDLGEGLMKCEYNSSDKYLYIDGYTSLGFLNPFGEKVKNISFNGYYYLEKKEESLDVTFEANPASLTVLNPLLAGIITFKTALIKGSGKVTGTPAKPAISGKFNLAKCEVKIDYTNVVYSMQGDIEILPDQIRFDEIKISDNLITKKQSGSINGNIFHNNFKDMRLDYDINFNNMLVLSTTSKENSTFFGKAYATGNFGIYGFLNNVKLEVNAKTEKGTQFSIALDGPSEVADKGFIKFVTRDTVKTEETHSSGFALDMNLKATQDAEAQIIFDAKSGDVIRARGNGDLQLKINNLGKFDMFGEYVISDGDYLFTLENFITKKFEIEKGSALNWSGNPYNAEIDITAVYRQRASIAPLFPNDSSGTYKRRYPVDCQLFMKNKLLAPDISFGIELPTIDENTRQKVKSAMLDESELNRQVFSLLLLKSFVTPLQYSSGGGVSAGSAVAANSSEMLSNRISGWLNSLTEQVDIGVNYRPGSQMSNDELDIALSKQLLNNRLSIDGNFGVNNNQNTNSTGLIGDVNVEYKLTEDGKLRIKGFNRSNDNTQITTSGGPFTQGAGVAYRREFETWKELYMSYLKKLKLVKDKKDANGTSGGTGSGTTASPDK